MATLLGATNGVFGIRAQQEGFLTESISYSFQSQKKFVMNHTGDRTGRSDYDEECTISITAKIPADSEFAGTIASAITLTSAIPDFMTEAASGLTIVDTIEISETADDYQGITLSATNLPTLTAS
jgi:hypothetical protein